MRSTPKEASTSQIPSLWECTDSQFFDSQLSPTKSLFPKRKDVRIENPSYSPISTPSRVRKLIPVPTPIDHMPKFMKPFFEKIMDVKGDGNCGFRAMGEHMGN